MTFISFYMVDLILPAVIFAIFAIYNHTTTTVIDINVPILSILISLW